MWTSVVSFVSQVDRTGWCRREHFLGGFGLEVGNANRGIRAEKTEVVFRMHVLVQVCGLKENSLMLKKTVFVLFNFCTFVLNF